MELCAELVKGSYLTAKLLTDALSLCRRPDFAH